MQLLKKYVAAWVVYKKAFYKLWMTVGKTNYRLVIMPYIFKYISVLMLTFC